MDQPIFSYNGQRLHHLEGDVYLCVTQFNNRVVIHVRNYVLSADHSGGSSRLIPTKRGVCFSPDTFFRLLNRSNLDAALYEIAWLQSELFGGFAPEDHPQNNFGYYQPPPPPPGAGACRVKKEPVKQEQFIGQPIGIRPTNIQQHQQTDRETGEYINIPAIVNGRTHQYPTNFAFNEPPPNFIINQPPPNFLFDQPQQVDHPKPASGSINHTPPISGRAIYRGEGAQTPPRAPKPATRKFLLGKRPRPIPFTFSNRVKKGDSGDNNNNNKPADIVGGASVATVIDLTDTPTCSEATNNYLTNIEDTTQLRIPMPGTSPNNKRH